MATLEERQQQQFSEFKRALPEFKERLQEKLQSNASYQQRSAMTKDERRREAVEIVARNRMERARLAGDAAPSYEKAKAESEALAEKTYNKRDRG